MVATFANNVKKMSTRHMALEFCNLHIGHNRHAIAGPMNLCVPKGALVALLGPNGAGKSTLLRTLAGDIAPADGRVATQAATSIAYLPQSPTLLRDAPIVVRDVVAMGLWGKLGMFGRPCSHDLAAVADAIETVGLTAFANKPLNDLSGGQIQRVLFARLAVQDCDVILLDEPFAALDEDSQNDLLAVVKKWHEAGKTIIVAVHDPDVAQHFPIWLRLRDGTAQLTPRVGLAPISKEAGLRVITGGVA
jgi:zinc/manganese transport system ATP-binding protein